MQQERRAFLRVGAELDVQLGAAGAGATQGFEMAARTLDVSAGGVKLRAERPLAVGERYWTKITFALPRFLVFTNAATVRVDEDPRLAAFRFEGLDRYIEQRVVRWVYAQDRRVTERRHQSRVGLWVRASCWRRAAAGALVGRFDGILIDVSSDGARLLADGVLPDGLDLRLQFEMGEPGVEFEIDARVAWTRLHPGARTEYGLVFPAITRAMQRRLVDRALEQDREARG
jgi:c-di-GMP-binding flagellar brake protein YcgR